MNQFERAVKQSGGKILGMKVVLDHDPVASLFEGMEGRIEEYTVQMKDGEVKTVRVANIQPRGTFYAEP